MTDAAACAERGRPYGSALRPGDRLPGGLVVVPEEATGGMIYEGGKAIQEHCDLPMTASCKAYTAMISAAGKEG